MNSLKILRVLTVFIVLLSIGAGPQAQTKTRPPHQDGQKQLDSFETEQKKLSQEWYSFERDQERQWQRLRAEIARKWQTVVVSSRRLWVDYDDGREARSVVDFKDGQIDIEAIVAHESDDGLDEPARKITTAIKKMFTRTDFENQPVMQNQLKNQIGQTVTAANLEAFIDKEVLPAIHTDPAPFRSQDGQVRRRYAVRIPMVADHIEIRLKKYRPLIEVNANRFGLPPELLAAVIHTESYFNPLAISHAGAIGLMQVIPKYAGRESYQYLYGQDWTIRPEYLYSPGVNMELGSAYLHLLTKRYFADIRNHTVNRYVSICAYNWGPTAVRRKIISRYDFRNMSPAAAMQLLRQKSPEETSKYLAKVVERMELYAGSFN